MPKSPLHRRQHGVRMFMLAIILFLFALGAVFVACLFFFDKPLLHRDIVDAKPSLILQRGFYFRVESV